MNTIALLQAGGTGAFLVQILPIAAIFLVFYFIVIAPANKQRKKTQEMLSALKKGDQVVTQGGIYATVQSVEPEVVYLLIGVGDKIKVKVSRSAITGVVSGETAE